MHEQPAQIAVAAFADAKQSRLAAAGTLARHQSDPGGELAAVVERARIANARNERARGQRADARDFRETATGGVVAMPAADVAFKRQDATIDLADTLKLLQHKPAERRRQHIGGFVQQRRHATDVLDPARQYETRLGKQATHLVDLRPYAT